MRLINSKRQTGLSLIELMIGIALSLLLILGVTQIFLSSKTTYSSNQALSAVQESGRFAIDILAMDIRNAGYKGQCLTMPVNHLDGGVADIWAVGNEPIHGWENGSPDFVAKDVVSGSDTLFFQFAAGGVDVTGATDNAATVDEITLSPDSRKLSIDSGVLVLVSDGLACDLFINVSDVDNALAKVPVPDVNWSHAYNDSFEALPFHNLAYYVAEDDDGVPTLYRSRFAADLSDEEDEALVPGIASLNLEYGIDPGVAARQYHNASVKSYVGASSVTNWADVLSVKVMLEAETSSGLKKNFNTIVGLRNRLR